MTSLRPVARSGREDRWPELMRVASDVIGTRGYAAASLQEIAERMDLLKGSLYHYVQTKEELLYSILREGHQRATDTIQDHVQSSVKLSGEPKLSSFIRLWMESGRYLQFSGLGGESYDYTRFLTGPHRAEIRGIRRAVADYLSDVIRSDCRDGFLRNDIDPGVASRSLLVIMNATHEWVGDYAEEWDDVAEWYVDLFLGGICIGEPFGLKAPDPGTEITTAGAPTRWNGASHESLAQLREMGVVRGERWEELVGIASGVFAEKTYPGASLSEIARKMNIRKASLYHYIETKEDLLFELQLRAHEDGLELVRSCSLDEGGSASERLSRFIVRWTDGLSRLNSAYIPLGKPDLQFMTDEHAVIIRSMRRTIRSYVTSLIAQGVGDGTFQPDLVSEYVTSSLFLSLNRSIRWYHWDGTPHGSGIWQAKLFLHGLGSPEWRTNA